MMLATSNSFGEKARKFYRKYEYLIFAVGLLAIAAAMRVSYFDYRSNDYNVFLVKWFEEIKASGGLKGFASTIGDYTPAYKYIITLLTYIPVNSLYSYKAVSCIFDAVLAVYVGLIVRRLAKSDLSAFIAYAAVLFLPNVFLNSAVWAQCDSIFTCFCVMSFYYLLKDKGSLSMAFFGIAFSFKIQAIFYAPVIVIAVLKGKLRLSSLPAFLLAYLLCALPAVMAGMNAVDALVGAYIKQTGEYSNLTMNAPNLYQMLPEGFHENGMATMAVFFAIGVCAIFCTIFYRGKYRLDDKNLALIAYLFTLLLPSVLPHMHERYYYCADIFALIFAFAFPNKSYIAAATIYCSLRGVVKYLFDAGGTKVDLMQVAVLMFAGLVALCAFAIHRIGASGGEREKEAVHGRT